MLKIFSEQLRQGVQVNDLQQSVGPARHNALLFWS